MKTQTGQEGQILWASAKTGRGKEVKGWGGEHGQQLLLDSQNVMESQLCWHL